MGLLPSSVEVSIEILLDRIDCPGLRLPHKEMTYMRIYLFDVDVRTGQAPPYLPIIFQEQFKFSKKFYAMKDWTELEVMLRFQALNVELLQRQIGGYSKILAEYQGNAWDVLVACNHDPVDSPVTSEGRARLVMKPTVHMPTTIAPECHVRFMVCTIGWTPPWRPYGATVGDKPSKSRRLGDSLPKVSWSSMESLAGRNKSRGSAGMGDQVTRGAIVSAEIDVLKVCCKSMRYRPSGRVYIQVTYLGQAASTVPKLPVFPLTCAETLVFREVLDASGDEGRFGVGAAAEHMSRARLRIELKQTGPTEHPVLGYVEVRGWQVLTPVEENMYSEIEENVQLKLLALGPFLYNDDPTVHLVTRTLIQPIRNPAPVFASDGSMKLGSPDTSSQFVRKSSRTKQTTDARPPFVVRRVPSNIFGASVQTTTSVKRARSLTRKSHPNHHHHHHNNHQHQQASTPVYASDSKTSTKACSRSSLASKKSVLFRSRSADDVAMRMNKSKSAEDLVRMHGTPPNLTGGGGGGGGTRMPPHDRRTCRVCNLYEEYFGECYPGHSNPNGSWSSSDDEADDDWGDRIRTKVTSKGIGAMVSDTGSDCSLSVG